MGRVDVIVLPARKMFLLIEKSGTEACLFRDDFRGLLRVYGEIVRLRKFTYSLWIQIESKKFLVGFYELHRSFVDFCGLFAKDKIRQTLY